jgi:hypothetical protein
MALFSCKHLLIEVLPRLWLQVVPCCSVFLRVSPDGLNKRELGVTNFLIFRFRFLDNAASSKAGNTELATFFFTFFTYCLPLL